MKRGKKHLLCKTPRHAVDNLRIVVDGVLLPWRSVGCATALLARSICEGRSKKMECAVECVGSQD